MRLNVATEIPALSLGLTLEVAGAAEGSGGGPGGGPRLAFTKPVGQ